MDFNLNKELIRESEGIEDVSILVGENGSGKSLYLNTLAHYHLNRGKKVIALANSIYDKFDVRGKRYKILKCSRGKYIAKTAIIDVLKIFSEENSENRFAILRALEYIGFDLTIGIRIKGVGVNENNDKSFQKIFSKINHFNENSVKDFQSIVNMYNYILLTQKHITNQDYLIMNLDRNDAMGSLDRNFIKILLQSSLLRKTNILSYLDFALIKKGKLIPLMGASSGELTLLTSLIFISANIDKETTILIDEPENSLHPKWQIEYIQKLLDLFYYYNPKIIIASHSPLIINGGKLTSEHINIFKGNINGFYLSDRNKKNVEEIYEEFFDVTTPENRYLSEFILDKFNLMVSNRLNKRDFENIINRMVEKSYDDEQRTALNGILKLAQDITIY